MSVLVSDLVMYNSYTSWSRAGHLMIIHTIGNNPVDLPKGYDYDHSSRCMSYENGNIITRIAVKGWASQSISAYTGLIRSHFKNIKFTGYTGSLMGGNKVQDTHNSYEPNIGKITMVTEGIASVIISSSELLDHTVLIVFLNGNKIKTVPFDKKTKEFNYSSNKILRPGDQLAFVIDTAFPHINSTLEMVYVLAPFSHKVKEPTPPNPVSKSEITMIVPVRVYLSTKYKVQVDTHDLWNPLTKKITCPLSGFYRLSIFFHYKTIGYMHVYMIRNGTEKVGEIMTRNLDRYQHHCIDLPFMNAGDTLELPEHMKDIEYLDFIRPNSFSNTSIKTTCDSLMDFKTPPTDTSDSKIPENKSTFTAPRGNYLVTGSYNVKVPGTYTIGDQTIELISGEIVVHVKKELKEGETYSLGPIKVK